MSTAKMVFHGSDIEKICEVYQLKSEEIVKFGANVNPLGLSEHVKEQLAGRLDILSSYPDRDYTSLRSTISEYCNIPAEFILPGNGSSELIALLIQERNPKHTLILGPTYSEYSRELSFSGSTQEYYHLREEDNFVLDVDDFCRTLDGKYDFLILCNPNNPTSSAISINDLRRIVSFCNEDKTYIRQTRDLILSERTRLLKALENIPTYKPYPAYANFLLLKIQKPGLTSRDVFDACIRQGLMIRECSSFECLDGEYIRFCIMHPEDNTRLLNILESL